MALTSMAILAAVEHGRWVPKIGDPTVIGWATVAAYFVAGAHCFLAAWGEPDLDGRRRPRTRPARFWLVLAIGLLLLGTNKQLDLQSFFTQLGRDVLKHWELYAYRQWLQLGFVLTIAAGCAAAFFAFLWAGRPAVRYRWPAVAGALFLFTFVVARASSFHHVDLLLAARVGGARWNSALELGGIGVVGAAALRTVLARPPLLPRPPNENASANVYHYRVNR